MENETAIQAESFIREVLSVVASNLEKDLIDFVKHYLYHAEYEMAFEGLFIAIMNFDTVPVIDWRRSIEVGKKLKLDVESIYDENFWTRFSKYVEGKINDDMSSNGI
ncbi:hypothetical protein [Longitalea luteola]|uniref:hypothetical protein n=1 Tax=Longitalea luteola TaxID=2812563 RepID=UPI001A97307E|nr:hypothetical protein [Longitalea luteola]